jgi:hypothetical protein
MGWPPSSASRHGMARCRACAHADRGRPVDRGPSLEGLLTCRTGTRTVAGRVAEWDTRLPQKRVGPLGDGISLPGGRLSSEQN